MPKTAFTFEEPQYLTLCLPNSEFSFDVDLFECWRVIEEGDKQPTDEARWKLLQDFILKKHNDNLVKLGYQPDDSKLVWEGTAREFRKLTLDEMTKYQETVKKKLELTASSPITIQDSQVQDGNTGPSGTNNVG